MSASLDWSIYSEMFRQSEDPIWGMFPNPSCREIAVKLGVSRGTVWRRLAALHKSGFLTGSSVIPNPRLLGVGLSGYRVVLRERDSWQRFLSELELVDGVILALVNLGAEAEVVTVSDLPASRERREEILRRISGVESVGKPSPISIPPYSTWPTLADWKLIGQLRRTPSWSLKALSTPLKASARATARRLVRLKHDRIILGVATENFSKFPAVVVGESLLLSPKADSESVTRAVERRFPDALEIPSLNREPGTPARTATFIRMLRAGTDTSEIAGLGIPGVTQVRTFFPTASRSYGQWFDARIAEMMAMQLHRPLRRSHSLSGPGLA
jgi:DNA-binding Lrp family transcriptional regulator